LATLNKNWEAKVTIPAVVSANTVTASKIYFMMFPAIWSYTYLAAIDPDFYPAQILNYRLGGSFASQLTQQLREGKG
jgi:zinc protease